MSFTNEQIEIANKTSRSGGAIGKNAIVPRMVREHWTHLKGRSILDFGAGKDACHAKTLRAEGFGLVDAWEFGSNHNDDLHVSTLRDGQYSLVYSSNVLNVQGDLDMLRTTLEQIHAACMTGGVFVANFPSSPRKGDFSKGELIAMVEEIFGREVKYYRKGSAPVFVVLKAESKK